MHRGSGEAVGATAATRVSEALARLERAEGVTVLWAVERSSRAFGTHRAGSDYDVLAVFSLSADALLSIHPPRKSLTLTLDSADAAAGTAAEGQTERTPPQITIHAHELRHACTLLAASNPTMFEALRSPIVYRDHPALAQARALMEETCDSDSLRTAYRKMARADLAKYVMQRGTRRQSGERRVLGKKYVHVMRGLLTADWLERRCKPAVDVSDDGAAGDAQGSCLPPITLYELAAPSWIAAAAREAAGELLSRREILNVPSPPRIHLEEWVMTRLSEPDATNASPQTTPGQSREASSKRWDAFCVKLLRDSLVAPTTVQLACLDEIGLRYTAKPSHARHGERYFGGDKTSEGQHFTAFYEHLLAPYRAQRNVQFLELGVWFGKSLAMWADYFDDGSDVGSCTVHGVDIDLRRFHAHRPELTALGAFRRNTVLVHELDTKSAAFVDFVQAQLCGLDVVLDDGDHTPTSQWRCFSLLFPRLRSGGLYIIEDIEKTRAFFGEGMRSSFGALMAAVASRSATHDADEDHHERELWAQREEAKVIAHRDRTARAVDGLKGAVARAGADDGKARQSCAHALAIKEKELAVIESTLDADVANARGAARAAFDERAELIRNLGRETMSVEVRTMNVVFVKR